MVLKPSIARLMTRDEKDLVRVSQSRSIAKLGEAVLRAQIERARHLRKKYDDLLQRQRAEAQSQRLPSGSRAALGNKKTMLKVDAFHDALARLELESARRAGQIIPTARKSAKKTKKKASKKGAAAGAPKASDRRGAKASAANGRIDPKKSDPKTVATSLPHGKDQSGNLRAVQNTLRHQRGPGMQQLGHAAARGRRVQARRDSVATRTRTQRAASLSRTGR
jgi:hypothetical protein